MNPDRDARPDPRLPRLGRLLPARARDHALALAIGLAAIAPTTLVDRSVGQAHDDDRRDRDVTVFCLRAEPGEGRIDPMLSLYAPQLRKLVPGHGLTLIDAASRRLPANGSLSCDLRDGRILNVRLLDPLGPDGKVHLRVQLLAVADDRERPVFVTNLHTPADQIVFLDKSLPDSDARLLIGVGAR